MILHTFKGCYLPYFNLGQITLDILERLMESMNPIFPPNNGEKFFQFFWKQNHQLLIINHYLLKACNLIWSFLSPDCIQQQFLLLMIFNLVIRAAPSPSFDWILKNWHAIVNFSATCVQSASKLKHLNLPILAGSTLFYFKQIIICTNLPSMLKQD